MLTSVVVDSMTSQFKTKDYEIGILCFSANHSTLMSKSKEWLSCSQKEESECLPVKCVGAVQNKQHEKVTCSHNDVHS